jgi:predicted nucleic acid-binding protein
MVFFDTNVFVYTIDANSPAKQVRAEQVVRDHLRDGTLVTSTQVMQESYNALTRRKALSHARAMELLDLLASQRVVASSSAFVRAAMVLSHEAQLSVWDALIVQAALEAGCSTLLSEDLQAGMRFGALEVVDPFGLAAHEAMPVRRRRRL